MGVGMDHLSNMVFAPCGYSRAVFSAYIEFMAHLLVLYSLEDSTNNSDLRSKTGLVLLELAGKYGKS